ncbi:MAG: hypothetical protein GVY13_12625 [Alphaproteobacteria bacterium]|jgi:hypothetical protein|nr:hypothetical protein [Alphaproteobacteria bacterium]
MKLMKLWNGTDVARVRGNNGLAVRADNSAEYDTVDVPVTSLDKFMSEKYRQNKQIALWVDVEGLAWEVLSGLAHRIEDCTTLFVELEDKHIWKGQKISVEVFDYLVTNGMIPIIRDFQSINQYNVVFIRKELYNADGVQNIVFDYLSQISKI